MAIKKRKAIALKPPLFPSLLQPYLLPAPAAGGSFRLGATTGSLPQGLACCWSIVG